MNEFELIRRYFSQDPGREDVLLGVGDDCALWQPDATVAIATDMLVGGRHFFDDVDPRALGHKALAVNLSDLAAMGADPRACTLGIALPQVERDWLDAFAAGLHAIAKRFGCPLIGGDTTRGPLNVCITVLGSVPREQALRRDAARAGDDLWVSGCVGGAGFAVAARLAGRPLPEAHPARRRLDWPEPRVALGLALRGVAACAIDLSDGLASDVAHLVERSGCGARIEWARVPVDPALDGSDDADRRRLALGGGDDYELLFTAPPDRRARIEDIAARLGLALTRIGAMTAGAGVTLCAPDGSEMSLAAIGFDHFGTADDAADTGSDQRGRAKSNP